MLGMLARSQQTKQYTQQFSTRGHPTNTSTDRLFQNFCNAQNEVLAACGVVVRKDLIHQRKHIPVHIPDAVKIDQLDSENKLGFIVKVCDRIAGNILTWWLHILRRQIVVRFLTSIQIYTDDNRFRRRGQRHLSQRLLVALPDRL